MDRDGMLGAPGELRCRRCSKGLDADGNHPAERYAGTFTGLCYSCESGAAYDTGVRELSGAEVWSHPPHCPSWRRDREEFMFFSGCDCSKGRRWVSRCDAQGGSYTVQCEKCWKRHYAHPAVIAEQERCERVRDARRAWERRLGAEYEKRCKAAGLNFAERHEDVLAKLLTDAPPFPPESETCPDFPSGWAAEAVKKARRRKTR